LDPRLLTRIDRHAQAKPFQGLIDAVELLADAGMIAMVTYTSPARMDRLRARERFTERCTFLEVFFDADLASCRSRLEALGRDPDEASLAYEPPDDPDVMIDGNELDIEREVDRLVRALERRGVLKH
jgi:bifunctional enzyme CysN/CysC